MTQPFSVPAGGGRATWTDGLHLYKALAAETGGALALWESLLPRGFSPPLHVHSRQDEAFYVLDGELAFRLGDRLVPAPAAPSCGVPAMFRTSTGSTPQPLGS